MPSTRQFRSITLIALLAICVIYYMYNGATNTYESDFYTRTKAAIERKKTSLERDQLLADEKDRSSRVERLRKEHDAAVNHQKGEDDDDDSSTRGGVGTTTSQSAPAAVPDVAAGGERRVKGQTPLKPAQDGGSGGSSQGKNGKVVQGAPEKDSDDGVAKIGNVRKPSTPQRKADGEVQDEDDEAAAKKKEEEAEVEAELNDILRKGPIIIFSKSYCPHSKKAKHILLDLYTITPAPYVVELDTHPLGPGLQNHLHQSTGRKTVPNILVNGRCIGGGDDIVTLHLSGKLIDTITSMGGKRIMSMVRNKEGAPTPKRFRS